MTDDKIIRVEKLIKTLHAYCFCSQTTYRAMGYKFCEDDFICLKELIDTINLQKANIERLQDIIQEYNDNNDIQQSIAICDIIAQAKSNAIKEFAERLKGAKVYSMERHENIVPVAVIDWIKKEMTENDFKG